MVCKLNSLELFGISGLLIKVEVDVQQGLPAIHIVGLADRALQEARLRVFAAIRNAGFKVPMQRIVVNLSPANIYKGGTGHDLAIALAVLFASRQLNYESCKFNLAHTAFWGELTLNADIAAGIGALPIALAARDLGIRDLIIPINNAKEAGKVAGIKIYPVRNFKELTRLISGKYDLAPYKNSFEEIESEVNNLNYINIKGNALAKRVLEIAAAGGHNCLLIGPTGIGKTALCEAFSSILPDLSDEEQLEVMQIASAAGEFKGLNRVRPFRSPHHSATVASFIGGGYRGRPGEISLAHKGVLFLDELNLFNTQVLDVLREPLETSLLKVSKFHNQYVYPADLILLAATNPCYCGNYGSQKKCTCSMSQVLNFSRRIPKPLLNRIDLQFNMAEYSDLLTHQKIADETSLTIKQRVEKARRVQLKRGKLNSKLTLNELSKLAPLAKDVAVEFSKANLKFDLSPRAQLRLWRVAKTIADLKQHDLIELNDFYEALCFRRD